MFRSPAKKIQKPYEVESLVYKTFRDRDKDRAKSPLNKTPIKIQQQQVQAQEATQQIDQLYSSMKQSVDFSIEQRKQQLKELKNLKDELKKEIKAGSQTIKQLKTTGTNDKMCSKSKINDQLQDWQQKVEEQLKEMQNAINQSMIQNYQSENDQFTQKVDQQPQRKQEGLTKKQLLAILEQFQNNFILKEENAIKLFCTQFMDKCNLDLSVQIKQEMARQFEEPKKSYRNKIKKTSESQQQQQQQSSSSQSQLLQPNEEQYNQQLASEIQKIMVLLTPCINDIESLKQNVLSLQTQDEIQNKDKSMNDQHDIQSQQIESISQEVKQLQIQQLEQLNTVNEQISHLQTQLSSFNKCKDSNQKSDIIGEDFESSITEIKQQLQQIKDAEPKSELTLNSFEKQFTDLQSQVKELMKFKELQIKTLDTDQIQNLCMQIQLNQQQFEQRLNELQLQPPQKLKLEDEQPQIEGTINLESLKESILKELQENINNIMGKLEQELDKQEQKQDEQHISGVAQIEVPPQKADIGDNVDETLGSLLQEQQNQLNEQIQQIQKQQQQLQLNIQEMKSEFQELSSQFVEIEQFQELSGQIVKTEQFEEQSGQIAKIEQITNILQVRIEEFNLVDQKQAQLEGNVLSIEEKLSNLEANQCNRKYQESTLKVINERISLMAKELEQLQLNREIPQAIIQQEEQLTDLKELYKLTKADYVISEIKDISEIVGKYAQNNEDLAQEITNQLSGYLSVKMDGNSLYTAIAYQYLLNEIASEKFYIFLELIEETNFEMHYQDKFNVSDQQIYRNEFIAKCKQIQEQELPLQQIMNDPLDSFYGLSIIYIRNLINYYYQKDQEIQKKLNDLEQNSYLLEWGKECENEDLLFELIAAQMELSISVYSICENNLSVKQFGGVSTKEINLFQVEQHYCIAIKQKL